MGKRYKKNHLDRAKGLLEGYLVEADQEHSQNDGGWQRYPVVRQFIQDMALAGYDKARIKKSIREIILAVIVLVVVGKITGFTILIWGAFCAPLIQILSIKEDITKRARTFESDFPAFLVALASSIKTGVDPLSAMFNCQRLFKKDSVLRTEIQRFEEAIRLGASEEEAIRGFAVTVQHPDISLFRAAFNLARKEGSSLAYCLQRIAKVTRQRQSFRRQMKNAVAMQKVSMLGIVGVGVVVGLFQVTSNRQALEAALVHSTGYYMLMTSCILFAVGVSWMFTLLKVKI